MIKSLGHTSLNWVNKLPGHEVAVVVCLVVAPFSVPLMVTSRFCITAASGGASLGSLDNVIIARWYVVLKNKNFRFNVHNNLLRTLKIDLFEELFERALNKNKI